MTPWLGILLGTERRQRLRLLRTLTAAAVYTFCLLLQWQAVWLGRTDGSTAGWLSVLLVAGVGAFYVAIRSGFNLRFAEPALTLPQMAFAMLALALAYLLNPHVRGALLLVVALVLTFGAFTLSPQRCRQLGWFAVAVLAAAMAIGTTQDPERFEPQIELVYFLFTIGVLPTISLLAGQLSQLRIDHQQQRRELRSAMQRLEMLAMHDEMTGLPNRRHVQEWVAHEAARSHRSGAPLGMAILDIDHFKRINDTLGHAVGDTVLRIFAREARRVLRDCDVLARWGGEEFLLVLPDTSVDDATVALHRLRAHMAKASTWVECPQGRVTFSAGLTVHPTGQTLDRSVRCADAALYEAKRLGRDQIVVA